MSSLFWINLRKAEKFRERRRKALLEIGHKTVNHDVTMRSKIKTELMKRDQRASLFEHLTQAGQSLIREATLRRSMCMLTLGSLKDDGLILLSLEPSDEENAYPHVGKRSHCNTVAFAFCPFAFVVVPGPGFGVRTFPGKLMQRVAQRFDTGIASMGFAIVATFI